MKVRCWKIHILTLILFIAVSHECTQNQSRKNKSKTDESIQRTTTNNDSGDGKLLMINTEEKKDETQNKGNGGNKEKGTKTKEEKREEIVKRRLGRNLQPNLQLASRILPVNTFPKVFPGLDDPHTYTDFILAIEKFSICSSPSTCQNELASLAAFADAARCAGKIVTFILQQKVSIDAWMQWTISVASLSLVIEVMSAHKALYPLS